MFLANRETISAKHVVVATTFSSAAKILPQEVCDQFSTRTWKSTRMLAFAALNSPLQSRTLVVSADKDGPIDNLCVPSDIAPSYAPPGASLVVASIRAEWTASEEATLEAVRLQLSVWFGQAARNWELISYVKIDEAARMSRPKQDVLDRLETRVRPESLSAATTVRVRQSTEPFTAVECVQNSC